MKRFNPIFSSLLSVVEVIHLTMECVLVDMDGTDALGDSMELSLLLLDGKPQALSVRV